MLNIKKIKIHNRFGGDIDGLLRIGKKSEQNTIDGNDWSLIDDFEQDIKLISDELVSKEYRKKSLQKLNEKCDTNTFEYFTSKIPFYSDFKEVSAIITNIKLRVNKRTNTIWLKFDNVEELINDLNSKQKEIKFLDLDTLEKIKIDFLPTSTYQELAISSGWSEEYMQIAENFDNIYKRINKKLLRTMYKNNKG